MSRRGLARHAARRDENEPQIRKRFAAHGWHTEQVSGKGMPDLLCWPPEYGHPLRWPLQSTFLVDVKMPKGKLEPAQEKKWAELAEKGIPVYVVRSEADVDALVRGELEPWKPSTMKSSTGRLGAAYVSAIMRSHEREQRATEAAREAEKTFAPAPDAPDMTPALGRGPHAEQFDCPCADCVAEWGAR